MNGLIQAISLGVIRSLATAGGGWLAQNGLANHDQVQSFIGSVCFLGGLGFTVIDKFVVHGKIKDAAASSTVLGGQ